MPNAYLWHDEHVATCGLVSAPRPKTIAVPDLIRDLIASQSPQAA